MIKPIRPENVIAEKKSYIPDVVIEAFNVEIVKHYLNGESHFFQKDIVERLMKEGMQSYEIYDNHYLDVENIYEDAGWKVVYDKPGYNETYDANFTFIRKSK